MESTDLHCEIPSMRFHKTSADAVQESAWCNQWEFCLMESTRWNPTNHVHRWDSSV
jgi:hypothetical protein